MKAPAALKSRMGRCALVLLFASLALASLSAQLQMPSAARAKDGNDTMQFSLTIPGMGPYKGFSGYSAKDGTVSYCLDQALDNPPYQSWITYTNGWSWVNDARAAIVHNGYPVTTNIGGKQFSKDAARAATQFALWMLSGTVHHDGSYSFIATDGSQHAGTLKGAAEKDAVFEAACFLHDGATSGTLKAPHNRTKVFHSIKDPTTGHEKQNMLYVMPGVEITVAKESAEAKVTANNGKYTLEGAVFDVFTENGTKVETITTGKTGKATVSLDKNRSYYLVETKAPEGFAKQEGKIAFKTGDDNSTVKVEDKPVTAKIKVVKVDAAVHDDKQAGASLAGAGFHLVSQGTPGWSADGETDAAGVVEFENVPLGKLTATETKAPEGYTLNTESIEIVASANGETVVPLQSKVADTPIAFDLEISKLLKDSKDEESKIEKPAAGVRFELVSNSTGEVVGSITTNENGYADTSKDTSLWFGRGERPSGAAGAIPYDRAGYTVHEVEETVPEGYAHIDDWNISAEQMQNGAHLQYIVNNHELGSHIQIVKCDALSDETVKLAGFTFQLLDADRNPIDQECWYPQHVTTSTFTTDENGSVTLPQSLKPGTYYLKETETVSPYLLLSEPVAFEVPDGAGQDAICTIKVSDKRATGRIEVLKRIKGTDTPLADASFDVIARKEIVSPTGEVEAAEGEVVAQITTDDEGKAATPELPLGCGSATYVIKETKAPEGYLLDESEHEITLTYEDAQTPVVFEQVQIENDFTKIDITKTDITRKSEVEGAKLSVMDADGKEIDSWTSNSEPHRVEHIKPGVYTLTEIQTPRTYDQAEFISFEVKNTGEVQQVEMKDSPIEISAEIDKRQEVAGGKNKTYSYTIDARNTSNTWVDEFTVTDELEAATKGLARLDSLQTPQAFGDFDGKFNVWYRTTSTKADNKTAGNNDDPINADANDIEKDGIDENAANATLDDGHVNSWLADGSTRELLGEDGRALDYNGWRLWKSNLDTSVSTTLTVDELDLKENETITGIRFEYGRVEAGFTTRSNNSADWDREDLFDEHDDIESAEKSYENKQSDEDALAWRGAILTLTTTDAYEREQALENTARVDAFRNGSGDKLEDHVSDRVVQSPEDEPKTPKTEEPSKPGDSPRGSRALPQTGIITVSLVFSALCTCCIVGAAIVHIIKNRMI